MIVNIQRRFEKRGDNSFIFIEDSKNDNQDFLGYRF